MLSLSVNDYDYDRLLNESQKYFDSDLTGPRNLQDVNYIDYKYINSLFLPLFFNDISVYQYTFCIPDIATLGTYLEAIQNRYENISQDQLGIIRLYAPNNLIDEVFNSLDSELYSKVPDAIQELYNKCMEQVKTREGLHEEHNIKTLVKLMKGKHIVILVSNYSDSTQASDHFLTTGLIPVLFPDWKEKFNEDELAFFKTLVNRSQVKRISNVSATEAFRNLFNNNSKYTERMEDIKFNSTIERIISNKISTARTEVMRSEQDAEACLRQFEEMRKRFYKFSKELNTLEHNRNESIEELKLALKMEGIVKVDISNSIISITFKAPITFFEPDEAELVINNLSDSWIKDFFSDIFIKQKYKLHIINTFVYDTNPQNRFNSPRDINTGTMIAHNGLFNPHTYFFACLGDYQSQLINAHSKQDILLFNNIALASTKSINFRDGAVINRWKSYLNDLGRGSIYGSNEIKNIKCLEDEEGNFHSIYDLYFKEQEETAVELDVEDTL